jgi:hypothetical protein
LASEEKAWHETKGLAGCVIERNLSDETNWAIAGTRGATSMTHIDDDGFGTAVRVMAGSKYWVVMRSREPSDSDDHSGDLKSFKGFPLNFQLGHTGDGYFEAEGIHLKLGDVL